MALSSTFYLLICIFDFICIFLTAVLTSIMLVTLILHWRTDLRSIMNLHAANACLAKLFFVAVNTFQMVIFTPRIYSTSPHEPNPILCKLTAASTTFGIGIVAAVQFALVVSRFCITIFSKHHFLGTFRINWKIIISTWINCALIAVVVLTISEAYQYEPESRFCVLTSKNFITSFVVVTILFDIIITTMFILYGIIVCHTIKHTRIDPNSVSARRAQRTRRIFQKTFVYFASMAIGGLPYFCSTMLNRIYYAPDWLYSIAYSCMFTAIVVSSIVHFISNKQIREIFLAKLLCREANRRNRQTIIRANQITPHPIPMRTNALPAVS